MINLKDLLIEVGLRIRWKTGVGGWTHSEPMTFNWVNPVTVKLSSHESGGRHFPVIQVDGPATTPETPSKVLVNGFNTLNGSKSYLKRTLVKLAKRQNWNLE